MAEPTFDRVAENYDDYLRSMRGWIRQEVVRHNLVPTLAALESGDRSGPLQVLDFGGGNANDALWLARRGHEVTIVDISERQLALGRLAVERAGDAVLASRLRFETGGVETLADRADSFDLALSHGVLQYELEAPEAQLGALAAALRPAGRLSLLTKGYYAAQRQMLAEGNLSPQERYEFEQSGRFRTHLAAEPARAYTAKQLSAMLRRSGFWLVEQMSGVRWHTEHDYRHVDDVAPDERAGWLELEIAAAHDPAINQAAAMLHMVAVKF